MVLIKINNNVFLMSHKFMKDDLIAILILNFFFMICTSNINSNTCEPFLLNDIIKVREKKDLLINDLFVQNTINHKYNKIHIHEECYNTSTNSNVPV